MSQIKDDAIRWIQALPDDCTLQDIQYHLYVREKVLRGLADVDAGRIISQAEAERRFKEWGASLGHNQPTATSKTS